MPFVRVLLVLVFGLAMVGPEAHHCPVHDQHASAPAGPSHHANGPDHQQASNKLCTCPQACCPVPAFTVAERPVPWTLTSAPTIVVAFDAPRPLSLARRKHLQPPALAPPIALS
jgi:hypothetical protein